MHFDPVIQARRVEALTMSQTQRSYPAASRRAEAIERRWEAFKVKIAVHSSLLATQGTLVLKRIGLRQFWYLRFLLPADANGRRRHRSVYLGPATDHEFLSRTRQLLEEYRQPRLWVAGVSAYAALAASVRSILRRVHIASGQARANRTHRDKICDDFSASWVQGLPWT